MDAAAQSDSAGPLFGDSSCCGTCGNPFLGAGCLAGLPGASVAVAKSQPNHSSVLAAGGSGAPPSKEGSATQDRARGSVEEQATQEPHRTSVRLHAFRLPKPDAGSLFGSKAYTGTPFGIGIVTISPDPPMLSTLPIGSPESSVGQYNGLPACMNTTTQTITDCTAGPWTNPVTVTLTAHPLQDGEDGAQNDSYFVGWGGDCASAGTLRLAPFNSDRIPISISWPPFKAPMLVRRRRRPRQAPQQAPQHQPLLVHQQTEVVGRPKTCPAWTPSGPVPRRTQRWHR